MTAIFKIKLLTEPKKPLCLKLFAKQRNIAVMVLQETYGIRKQYFFNSACNSIPSRGKTFSLLRNIQTSSGA
jgi:hypothetical protein